MIEVTAAQDGGTTQSGGRDSVDEQLGGALRDAMIEY
jgi:hypothetical protein